MLRPNDLVNCEIIGINYIDILDHGEYFRARGSPKHFNCTHYKAETSNCSPVAEIFGTNRNSSLH